MKRKIITLIVCFAMGFFALQAQRTTTFDAEKQNRIETLKQEYLAKGFPEEFAEARATSIVNAENQMTLRSRVNPPSANSIWVDRDTSNWTSYHPVYHNYTPEQFVKKVLLNNPAAESAITNVRFTGIAPGGASSSLAYFENGGGIGFKNGLLLGTGDVLPAEAPNTNSGQLGGGTIVTGDPNLTSIATSTVKGGSILEFDFKPFSNKVTFDYIFASEEYPDYSNQSVNDAFGFFVWEVNPVTGDSVSGTTRNIALFPNGQPVTINNSNWGHFSVGGGYNSSVYGAPQTNPHTPPYTGPAIAVNPQWHVPNYWDSHSGSDSIMEYDGRTIKLQAVADKLDTKKTYHLKMAICNISDNAFGSAVFLANLDLGTPDVGVGQPYLGAWNSAWDEYGENHLYSNCTQTMTLEFDPDTLDREIAISYVGVASKRTIVQADGKAFPDTLELLAGDSVIVLPFKTLTVPLEDNGKEGAIVACIVGGGCDTMQNKSTGQLFKFYSGISTDIKYIQPTTNYAGSLKLNISGGSNYLFRSIDKGLHWEFARDTASGEERPFTNVQVDNFNSRDKEVWLREPNACAQMRFKHFTKDTLNNAGFPRLSRMIRIPNVPDAILGTPMGIHFVNSGQDFSFKITPIGENAGKTPVVKTGRISLPDKKGVYIQDNGDGSFTVHIYRVREPLELDITFTSNNSNSNADVDNQSVWSEKGMIYISAVTSGRAQVYNISGVLLRTIDLHAGRISRTAMPSGFYVVVVHDGRKYKLVVK